MGWVVVVGFTVLCLLAWALLIGAVAILLGWNP